MHNPLLFIPWVSGMAWSKDSAAVLHKTALWKSVSELHRTASDNERTFVLYCSAIDWLDPQVPDAWLAEFFRLVHETPKLTWLLPTTHPEQFKEQIAGASTSLYKTEDDELSGMLNLWYLGRYVPPNVWVGASVTTQASATALIPNLLKIKAAHRFIYADLTHKVSLNPLEGLEGISHLVSLEPHPKPSWLNQLQQELPSAETVSLKVK